MNEENQLRYQRFQLEEAKWLDGIVRPFIPKWMQWVVEKNNKNVIGRMGHFIVDFFFIGKILGIKITRNQDTEILGGKGFRPDVDHGYVIKNIHVTVFKRKKEIAKQTFQVNIHFKN